MLVLAREPPFPPNAGDRIVTHGILQALALRGHEPHLLTYADDGVPEALTDLCATTRGVRRPSSRLPLPPAVRKLSRAALGRSDVMAMFDSETFASATVEALRVVEPDLVLAEHPYMGQFLLRDRVRRALEAVGAGWVTNAHVVEFAAHRRHRRQADTWKQRLLLTAEVPRLRRKELAVYRASDRVLVLGEDDRVRLSGEIDSVACQRVPLDVDAYPPVGTGGGDSPSLFFFGSYDWFPNEHGARRLVDEIWPRVRSAVPEAECWLAGRQAPEGIRDLDQREGVRFLGEVEDLAEWVRRARVVVAPLWVGGGVRIKVLESMAWAAPVVTTETGFEGVQAPPGEALCVAERPQAFAEQAVELLTDRSTREQLGRRARATIEKRYALEPVSQELEANLGLRR